MQRVSKCKITRVVDGDTVQCEVDLNFKIKADITFRLAKIDAPEMREGEPATIAKFFLMKYLNQPMVVLSSKQDKYGRWIGEFWRESEFATGAHSVNELMLELNFAKPYEG